MISQKSYSEAIYSAILAGATDIPPDVLAALKAAGERETNPAAKLGFERTCQSLLLSREKSNPCCPDTGWPVFYVKLGTDAVLEGGMLAFESAVREAVALATERGYIRATMKHPLTGYDPGNNIGSNIPPITYRFVEGDAVEVTYVAKGGGSECFGGTRHRVVAFADGIKGIEKFIIDSFVEATRSGGICPPNILGIGIGGTANLAANLAKEAACLRLVGSHHPEEAFKRMEAELYEALNSLGVGIMGIGGNTSVLAVHIEYAYTHIAGISVDMSTNCMVARRGTYRADADGRVTRMAAPMWFGDR